MKHWTLQLAEFFFADFWRYLGLVVLVGVFGWSKVGDDLRSLNFGN